MDETELILKKTAWYKKWWGRGLIVILVLFVFVLGFFLYKVYTIYQQVKEGTYVTSDFGREEAPYDMAILVDQFSPRFGNENANITIVEFGDFNCSRCLQAFPAILELKSKYSDKINFYWRNYPVVRESSFDFAKVGICAERQGVFWAFHDAMFARQGNISLGNVNEVAIEVGADKAELEACLINPMTLPQLRKDYFTAVDGEIRGTPTFFINGYKMEGAIPFEVWEKIIARLDIYEQD